MSRQISPEAGYAAEQAQIELDTIELNISHDRTNVEQLEALISKLKDRQGAAQELLGPANRALQRPREPGMPADFYAAPTRDKRMAEATLAECAEQLSLAQDRLKGVKARLAQNEGRKKQFGDDALRAGRMLDALRRRMSKNG